MKTLFALAASLTLAASPAIAHSAEDATALALAAVAKMEVGERDWPQWGGSPSRNNTPDAAGIPEEWDVRSGKNILWSASLGSQTYGNPVVANGKVYVGTNNHRAYLPRYPKTVDLGVLVCFDEKTGDFLWQHSSPKLSTGRVHDWPDQGICCAPYVDGNRLWFVTSRGEVRCLDTEGFRDGENDGPYKSEDVEAPNEADVIWVFDMMGQLGVSQHNMCNCSITGVGDIIFVCTSNGVDESHINIPAPDAPSFFAMNRDTAQVLWTDKSPGINVLHGQWSSPAYGVFGDMPQVVFGGGDGYLYSFAPEGDGKGNAKVLWKFDCNPKTSFYELGGGATRNHLIATPVIYDGKVYVAVGEDPEHGEGNGHLWCIDPLKKTDGSDVSPTLAVNAAGERIPIRRVQAVIEREGEREIENPDSAVLWHYTGGDINGNGELEWEEEMHRSCGTVAIKDDILYIADFSGLVHCLNAQTGEPHWTYDMFAQAWGSPLIVDGKVYIGDEDGDVCVFEHSIDAREPMQEISMSNSVYSTPVVANGVLYIANKSTLYAIQEGAQSAQSE